MAASRTLQFPTPQDRSAAPDGHDYVICQLDRTGRVMSRSPGAIEADGFSDEDVIGQHVRVFYTRDDVARNRPETDLDAAAAAELYEDAGWRVRKNGSRYWADVLITPTHENGRLLGFSFVMRALHYRRPAERLPASFRKLAEALIDTVRAPVLLLDANLRITRASESFHVAFGLPSEDVIGASLLELAGGAWDVPEVRLLRGAGPARRRAVTDLHITRDFPGAGRRTLVVNGRHLALGDERSELVVLSIEDVTRETAAAIVSAGHRDGARVRADVDRVATVVRNGVHEPMRAVETMADRLLATSGHLLPLEARLDLAVIAASAARTEALVSDLVAWSRVATREAPFEQVDLGATMRDVMAEVSPWLEAVGGVVDVGSLPVIEADPLQMRQLLQNLIDNALKFHRTNVTPAIAVRGGITEGRCRLTISDNGIGVESEDARRIFGLFERVPTVRQSAGTGVGLAICDEIVARHGGTIAVERSLWRGAQFIVDLPVSQAADRTSGG